MDFKAFVSSTLEDLREHRAWVIGELRRVGFSVAPMEEWTADAGEPKRFSQERLRGCDLCVLLVAFRRGHVPTGEEHSITQLEYLAARELGIDILVFMLDENAAWPRRFDELDEDQKMRPWRTELMENHGVEFFRRKPRSLNIAAALIRWVADKKEEHYKEPPGDSTALAHFPELEALELDCREGSPDEAMIKLREIIIERLRALASSAGHEESEASPMHILRRLAANERLPDGVTEGLEYALTVSSEVLYDRSVSGREGAAAVRRTAMALDALRDSSPRGPKFQVELQPKTGKYWFAFQVGGTKLLSSDSYTTLASAKNGIRSVRRNVERKSFRQMKAKSGQRYFQLIAPNGEVVATSSFFPSDAAMQHAIAAVTRHVPSAPVIDLSRH